jgi:hypothetical protein
MVSRQDSILLGKKNCLRNWKIYNSNQKIKIKAVMRKNNNLKLTALKKTLKNQWIYSISKLKSQSTNTVDQEWLRVKMNSSPTKRSTENTVSPIRCSNTKEIVQMMISFPFKSTNLITPSKVTQLSMSMP